MTPTEKKLENSEQRFASGSSSSSSSSSSSNQAPVDYDTIDYSNALKREQHRSETSKQLWNLNAKAFESSQHVLTGFVTETIDAHEGVSNNEVVFDVLPSFEMYQSIKSLDNDNYNGSPPDYVGGDNPIESVTSPEYYEPADRSNSFDFTKQSTSSPASFFDTASGSTENTGYSSYSEVDNGPFDKNTLDNVHRLPKLRSNDISIQITVTKNVPTPYKKCESESMLKEYTSGDVVHGYVTITNHSNKRIPFHSFYVTLEGIISIFDFEARIQTVKTFLNTIDISASWTFGIISPSANISFIPGTQDYDGCYLALRNDRVLEPNASYKKFFTFKFPYNTLDTTCHHQQELHTLLPPSLGLNTVKDKGKYSHITVSSGLGYGHSSKKGSPILTRDLSNDKISINYSVNAVLVGTNPRDLISRRLVCLADCEYALRFIPFGFGVSLFSSQKSLNYLKKLTEYTFKNAERRVKLALEGNQKGVEELHNELKIEQLRLNPNTESISHIDESNHNFPLRNEDDATSDFSKVETGLTFVNSQSSLLSKFKSNNDTINNGFISITTTLPKDGLPYISPKLIMKTNEISKLNTLGIANYNLMSDSLSKNEKKKLTSIKISLKFTPSDKILSKSSNNSTPLVEPPTIKSIQTKLMVINCYSTGSIPIKLSSDLFIDKDSVSFKKLIHNFEEYYKEYERISSEIEMVGLESKDFFPKEIIQDIQSMKNLKFDNYFLPVFNHTVENQTLWKHSKNLNEFSQSLQLNVEFKDNIQETLIPTFQSCLISRHYCIQVDVGFKNGQNASLRVPVRLRQFDGN